MKKLIIIVIVIWAQQSYAQKRTELFNEDEKIKLLLDSIRTQRSIADSITLRSFYIKITPKKHGNIIYLSNTSANQFYNKIDSTLSKLDFKKFLNGNRQKHIIIPFAILLYEHNKMRDDEKFNIWELKDAIPNMMANDDPDRYNSIFLKPVFIFLSTLVYN